ncbi:hypothetical protein [Microvirga massiliensis]|uniref:hypothetical protein n=1 Tax=Microvirga massiliensis TaxID=1033741 RepID=UPI00062BEEE8|nr:hypothetical protein [Microvirga massiliensis]
MSDLAAAPVQPACDANIASTPDVSKMGRDEFIAAHRNRLFRPKGKKNYYVVPVDREPLLRNAHALPQMSHGKLRPGVTLDDALGALYDETPAFGRVRKAEQREKDAQTAGAAYSDKCSAARAFYSGLDLETAAQRFADLLGQPKCASHKNWVEALLVAAHTGEFGDHLRLANKRSKALFGSIFGVKLPSTDKGTRELLAQRAPWPLPQS